MKGPLIVPQVQRGIRRISGWFAVLACVPSVLYNLGSQPLHYYARKHDGKDN